MTQQKSEDRIVPEGGVIAAPPHRDKTVGGGKAVPVDEQVMQLDMTLVPAENPEGATGTESTDLFVVSRLVVPKAKVNAETCAHWRQLVAVSVSGIHSGR